MFRLMLQRILHKKWMVICLLIGNILLIAVAAGYPMYKNASLNRMLKDEFTEYSQTVADDPTLIKLSSTAQKGEYVSDFYEMDALSYTLADSLDISLKLRVAHYNLVTSKANSLMVRDDTKEQKLMIGSLTYLQNYAQLVSGRMYADSPAEDGCIEAVVTTAGMVKMNLLVGEVLEFPNVKNANGDAVRIRVVGVVEDNQTDSAYWVMSPDSYKQELLISQKVFIETFLNENIGKYYLHGDWYILTEQQSITTDKAGAVIKATEELLAGSTITKKIEEPGYLSVLRKFQENEKKIHATLLILQIPVMALLLAFLFMISGQMMQMEQNEISLLKSRGAGKRQIVWLYFLQCVFLSAVSVVLGLPLGVLFCKVLGSANAFLEFVAARGLQVEMGTEVLIYTAAAVVLSVLITVLPALSASGVTIVHLKQKRARNSKKLWQKLYLDLIIIGVSLYGYYSFVSQKETLVLRVLNGEALDPLLYLSSALFVLGVGMFYLRIQPLLIQLLFSIRKNKWSPQNYASFLQTLRTQTKQQFIMLFLVLTVALGIFNGTVARTIISNAQDNKTYLTGTDLTFTEVWKSNELLVRMDPTVELVYEEPDFGKYKQFSEIESVTKVFKDDEFTFKDGKNTTVKLSVMGIETKEFGETICFDASLLPYHINTYLNVLAKNPDGVLLSASFKTIYGYRLGDSITYYNAENKRTTGTVCGFVDYWPTYRSTEITLLPDDSVREENKCFLIANLAAIQAAFQVTPYQVWMKTKNGETDFFYQFAEKENIKLRSYTDLNTEQEAIRRDTLFQGTNGILTMSFIIILILCCAGYLIYWIMSIRSRELLFGVFRAMGMKKKEIFHMLFNEQMFTGLLSILAGAGTGYLASKLYVPMIQITYAASDQVLPLSLTMEAADLIKLFAVILIVMMLCIFILARIVSAMKIANALKLGED